MDDKVIIENDSEVSAAVQKVWLDVSSDKKSGFSNGALLFDRQYAKVCGVDQWGNEWESDVR